MLPATILAASTVTATWTNGVAQLPVHVTTWDSGGTTLLWAYGVYPPGTIGPITLNDSRLASSTTYTLKVTHLDELGGESAAGSTTFTTPSGFGTGSLTAPSGSIIQGV